MDDPQDKSPRENEGEEEFLDMDEEYEELSLPKEKIQASGLVKMEEKPQENRCATDIILGNINLIRISESNVKIGYYFSFLNSRPILYIGRNKQKCGIDSILLEDECISPCHASISWKEGKFYIQDEGSSCGTFVNDKKLISFTNMSLPSHCRLQFGDIIFLYKLESPEVFFGKPIAQEEKKIETSPVREAKEISFREKSETISPGYVIAEFVLLSLDAACALPHHCEILSNRAQFTIGRSRECDYQVEFKDKYVAEEQAAIVYSSQEQVFIIKGLIKENPIFVNNQRVKDAHRLKSGDIIRLGVALNAPKVRFSLDDGEKDNKKTENLSDLIEALERGKIYTIGNSPQCNIRLEDPAISGTILEIQVPERSDHLLVTKVGHNDIKVTIDGLDLKEKESRAISMYQTLQIGNFYSLVHNHQNFVVPRIARQILFSEVVPFPKRGDIYGIGRAENCVFKLDDAKSPYLLAEIFVPIEGESFLVKKIGDGGIPVTIDGEAIQEGPRSQSRYGVNQVLGIGDYLSIRNNHRALPAASAPFSWGKLFYIVFWCLFFAMLVVGAGMAIQKYWDRLETFVSSQNKIKEYQKNVFYISVLDKSGKNLSSGTGFLLVQKDAQDRDVYYIVTCKHVIEPWKFENHLEKEGKIFNEKGEEIPGDQPGASFIFIWPYLSKALDSTTQRYIPKNSFTNANIAEKTGTLEIIQKGQDEYEKLEKGMQCHKKKSTQDIAILKLVPEDKNWKYDYYRWTITSQKQIEVGESVFVLGYPLGGSRLLDKEGIVIPVSSEGKLVSDCIAPAFLEIDVNQNHGASGGPIVDKKGYVLGMLTFSDKEKKLIYGIHGQLILNFMK